MDVNEVAWVQIHMLNQSNKKIFYSDKTVTLINMNNISNTVIRKNKATQKEESR